MNSSTSKVKRLLHHLPHNLLKIVFDNHSKREDLIDEVVSTYRANDLMNVFLSNQNWTKQYVEILYSEIDFDNGLMKYFPFEIYSKNINLDAGVFKYWFWQELEVMVNLFNEYEQVSVKYYQLYQLTFEKGLMIFSTTKIEDDVTSLFPESRNPTKAYVKNDYVQVRTVVHDFLYDTFGANFYDLNKGIKELWENNVIDARRLKYRDSSSIEQSIMEEDHTFKGKYPERYKEIISKHLERTLFRVRDSNYDICEVFEIEPHLGFINITRYPKSPYQVKNLIDEICNRNK